MTDANIAAEGATIPAGVYHEKQTLMRCGLHSVNNMLQRKAFDVSDFDTIARSLVQVQNDARWSFNPHQTVLGIGNYGVEVLIAALLRHGYSTCYFDRRKATDTIDLVVAVDGLLCNVPSSSMMGLWQSRHWFTIRQVHGVYYNLDSKLPAPLVQEQRMHALLPSRMNLSPCT
ncbi:hypothetical protein H257_05064 [Aphanomyces astaci]|uniref:ubiquitinyl hydrolase 1 n=1 Tax=Aphanomyces astaci TaxID=112090 RepID=W4GTS5_APHAT|nr:hypothetical protein H257_05064 [Aphanomyces astaci]ETV82424.1 hypothetical protein H257_05064 [Aphanomyces astaci]|eukprot:XP_009828093.1 hypothetical protein H257_05064 [Aphanomyces astaci]